VQHIRKARMEQRFAIAAKGEPPQGRESAQALDHSAECLPAHLARSVAQSSLESRARLGFPMAKKEHAAEVLAKLNEKKAA
ncbi:MAG: hypothetical protein ACK4Q4_05315, partial [Rhodocyclaceae bacterium]